MTVLVLPPKHRLWWLRGPYAQATIDADHQARLAKISAGDPDELYRRYEDTATYAMYEANIQFYNRAAQIVLVVAAVALLIALCIQVFS